MNIKVISINKEREIDYTHESSKLKSEVDKPKVIYAPKDFFANLKNHNHGPPGQNTRSLMAKSMIKMERRSKIRIILGRTRQQLLTMLQ